MPFMQLDRILSNSFLYTPLLLLGLSSAQAETAGPSLTDGLMNRAIGYVEAVTGRDVGAEDSAWLKREWSQDHAEAPGSTIVNLEEMALKLDLIEADADPVVIASYRNELIDNTYCAREMTSDPTVLRATDILAPDDAVLAADCVIGLVVTTFDVEGLTASHALIAEITGLPVSSAPDRQTLMTAVPEEFETWELMDRELAAAGEARHAVAERFWSLISAQKRSDLAAELTAQAASDGIMRAARNLETLALQNIASVDRIVAVGDARLTEGMVGEYLQWLQRVAGYPFSMRDRLWVREAIIEEFQADPANAQAEIARIEAFNDAYDSGILDLATEQDRLDWQNKRTAMLDDWAVQLHCGLSTSKDPDEARLLKVIFALDPVVSSDCAAGKVMRRRDTVLAEAGGHMLTEGMVSEGLSFLSLLLNRSPTSEEEAFVRQDTIRAFQENPQKALSDLANYRSMLLEYDGKRFEFQKKEVQAKLLNIVYCSLKSSSEPSASDYLNMLQRANPIAMEDCASQVVTTERDVDAFLAQLNFLVVVAGGEPFSQTEETEMIERIQRGELGNEVWLGEVGLAALTQYWSWLDTEKKNDQVSALRKIDVSDVAAKVPLLNDLVVTAGLGLTLMEAERMSCTIMAMTAEHETRMFSALGGPSSLPAESNDAAIGYSSARMSHILSSTYLGSAVCG